MALCFDAHALRGTQVRYVPLRSDSGFHIPRKALPLTDDALQIVMDDVRRRAAVAQHYSQPMHWIIPRDYLDALIPGAGIADLPEVATQLQGRLRTAGSLLYEDVHCCVDELWDTVALRIRFSRTACV